MTLQDVLHEYRYWIFGIAVVFVLGAFALIRSNWLLRQRTLLLVENNRELDFQNLALDEHAIVSTADVKGNITYVNDKFCEISGYSREELLDQNHRILKSDEHSIKFYSDMWRTIAKGKPWHGEIKNFKKGGGYYWVEATIVPFLNKQGKPVEYVGLRTDITARKDAEAEKSKVTSQEIRQYKATLDLSQDRIHMFWPNTLKYFYANQSALKHAGCSEDEFYKMTPLDVNPTLDEEALYQRLTDLTCGDQKTAIYETAHPNALGEMVPVEVLTQYITPKGEKPRFVSVIRDISKRKVAERATHKFKTTLDLTQDEVTMFWPDTLKFFYVNQSVADKSGSHADSFYGLTPEVFNPHFDEARFRELVKPLILGTQKSIVFETVFLEASGKLLPREVLMQLITVKGEKPYFVAVARNITERQKVDKAKAEFISTVSHELRTPLTSIKGVLGLIMAGAFDKSPEKLQPMVRIAYDNSERLNLLIDDLLDIEKFNNGKLKFQMNPTNLNWLIEEAIEANAGYGDKFGVTLVSLHNDLSLVVNADRDRLMQVMANLLSNAVKFSPRGGKVEVSVSRRNERIRIAVKDYGSGIPEEARATIFDRFTQADSSDQRAKGGTGLGLNITKTIVEGHGGTISFTSEMGKGTTFYVDLPEVEANCEQQTFEFNG